MNWPSATKSQERAFRGRSATARAPSRAKVTPRTAFVASFSLMSSASDARSARARRTAVSTATVAATARVAATTVAILSVRAGEPGNSGTNLSMRTQGHCCPVMAIFRSSSDRHRHPGEGDEGEPVRRERHLRTDKVDQHEDEDDQDRATRHAAGTPQRHHEQRQADRQRPEEHRHHRHREDWLDGCRSSGNGARRHAGIEEGDLGALEPVDRGQSAEPDDAERNARPRQPRHPPSALAEQQDRGDEQRNRDQADADTDRMRRGVRGHPVEPSAVIGKGWLDHLLDELQRRATEQHSGNHPTTHGTSRWVGRAQVRR